MLGQACTVAPGQHTRCRSPALLHSWGPGARSERQCGRPGGGQGGAEGRNQAGETQPSAGKLQPSASTTPSLLGVALSHDCLFSKSDPTAALHALSPVPRASPSLRRRWRTALLCRAQGCVLGAWRHRGSQVTSVHCRIPSSQRDDVRTAFLRRFVFSHSSQLSEPSFALVKSLLSRGILCHLISLLHFSPLALLQSFF